MSQNDPDKLEQRAHYLFELAAALNTMAMLIRLPVKTNDPLIAELPEYKKSWRETEENIRQYEALIK